MKYSSFLILLFFTCKLSFAQQENICDKKTPIQFSGYADLYYGYDFNEPDNNSRPPYVYSYNRHNETTLNLAIVKGAYQHENIRSNLALMAGTYANANLAAETATLQHIYEANLGIKLATSHELWLDAGIFPSHIGFESAIGKDCWNLTRSLMADNSPYYEAGVKLSYSTENGKWFLSALVLNGWQRMQRVTGNSLPSFGTQVTFTPNKTITVNSSTFIGTDKPDSARQMRYFHNFYAIVNLNERWAVTLAADVGLEQKSPEQNSYHTWHTEVIAVRVKASNKTNVSLRGEYYHDPNNIIIASEDVSGFSTFGVSGNVDLSVAKNVLWRMELKHLFSKDELFIKQDKLSKNNTVLTTSLSIYF